MKNKLNKTISITILLLFNLLFASGQTEYLVTVNSSNSAFTKIDSLPGVKTIITGPHYTTFDKNHHRYIFKGADANSNCYLYSVDASNGNIISKPSIPSLYFDFSNLKYDNSSNILYGLRWVASENREYFGTVNPTTGVFSSIDSLPGVISIAIYPPAFDEIHHVFIFIGSDKSGIGHIYFVNANTGNIISSPIINSSNLVGELQFDNITNTLYGLHWNSSDNREYFVSVNQTNGILTTIDSLPGVKAFSQMPNLTTYDEIHHRYIFVGINDSGHAYLNSVDVNTGNIITNPIFPIVSDPADNVIELEFDNVSGILYALHWEAHSAVTGIFNNEVTNHFFNISPNPFLNNSKIEFDKSYNEIKIFIYNSLGQLEREETHFNSSIVTIQKNNLLNGIYFISVICNHQNIGIKKIIIE